MSALRRTTEEIEAHRSTVKRVLLKSYGLLGLLEHVEIGLENPTTFLFAAKSGVLLVTGQIVAAHFLANHLHTTPLALFLYWVEIGVRNLLFGQELPFGLSGTGFLKLLDLQFLCKIFIVVRGPGSAVIARACVSRRENGVEK